VIETRILVGHIPRKADVNVFVQDPVTFFNQNIKYTEFVSVPEGCALKNKINFLSVSPLLL
jgi:hypothetical protein